MSLRVKNALYTLGIRLKYGEHAGAIAKKYNLQNLIGREETNKLIKNELKDQKILKIALKESRPPWFVRNITLSAFCCNKGFYSTFSKDCVKGMMVGTLLYRSADLKDDFSDNYLEKKLPPHKTFEEVHNILLDEKNLVYLARNWGIEEASLIANASYSLINLGRNMLKEMNEKAFEEYEKFEKGDLNLTQAKDFFYRFCLKKGRMEEVRKELSSIEKILETQKKLGKVGETWIRVSHLLAGGEEKYLEPLGEFFLYSTSLLNLAADDLKEAEDDFSYDGESKVGIKNPANILALCMISEGYNWLSLSELKKYLKEKGKVVYKMLNYYFENVLESYERAKDSPYEKDLSLTLGLTLDMMEREVKKFEKKFNVKVKF